MPVRLLATTSISRIYPFRSLKEEFSSLKISLLRTLSLSYSFRDSSLTNQTRWPLLHTLIRENSRFSRRSNDHLSSADRAVASAAALFCHRLTFRSLLPVTLPSRRGRVRGVANRRCIERCRRNYARRFSSGKLQVISKRARKSSSLLGTVHRRCRSSSRATMLARYVNSRPGVISVGRRRSCKNAFPSSVALRRFYVR